MSILSVIALFGAGYMYRDYSQYKTWRRPVNYNYGGYSYNRPQTIKQYLKNVAMDKMDVIFYGEKKKQKRQMVDCSEYYKRVCNGIKNYDSNRQYEITQDEYYDYSSADYDDYDKQTFYMYADRFEDSFEDRISRDTIEAYIGSDMMKRVVDLGEGDAMYIRDDKNKIDYEIIMEDEKYCG